MGERLTRGGADVSAVEEQLRWAGTASESLPGRSFPAALSCCFTSTVFHKEHHVSKACYFFLIAFSGFIFKRNLFSEGKVHGRGGEECVFRDGQEAGRARGERVPGCWYLQRLQLGDTDRRTLLMKGLVALSSL